MKNIEVSLEKEYLLAGDISASMETIDPLCAGLTRYQYMLEKFKLFMNTTRDFDKHGGATVMLFGAKVHKYEHANLETVQSKLNNVVFENATMIDLLLQEAFAEHLEEKEKMANEGQLHPGTVLMIFTDGEPTNKPNVLRVIDNIANRIDRASEFQIIFLTVGTISESLRQFLSNLCNTSLKHHIVRVESLDQVSFIAAAGVAA